jgi:PhzF family phenazine biosynthesis protein
MTDTATHPLYQVDSFTREPFAGNPAAVCLTDGPADEKWMQRVAAEMNLSETAFLHPGDNGWNLRWFTPALEVDLCGHATLAAAHVLWNERGSTNEPLRFFTRSGELTARRLEHPHGSIELDFPIRTQEEVDDHWTAERLALALGESPVYLGRSMEDYLAVFDDPGKVLALRPDIKQMRAFTIRGVIVTAPSRNDDWDFVSRFFAPGAGIDEDPVTGSAHCCLGPYWAACFDRDELVGYQASQRGGRVGVKVVGERVLLRGDAVTVIRGELTG